MPRWQAYLTKSGSSRRLLLRRQTNSPSAATSALAGCHYSSILDERRIAEVRGCAFDRGGTERNHELPGGDRTSSRYWSRAPDASCWRNGRCCVLTFSLDKF